jgi:hypothetical protein
VAGVDDLVAGVDDLMDDMGVLGDQMDEVDAMKPIAMVEEEEESDLVKAMKTIAMVEVEEDAAPVEEGWDLDKAMMTIAMGEEEEEVNLEKEFLSCTAAWRPLASIWNCDGESGFGDDDTPLEGDTDVFLTEMNARENECMTVCEVNFRCEFDKLTMPGLHANGLLAFTGPADMHGAVLVK